MEDSATRVTLTGRVYYDRIDENTGTIRIITFGSLPDTDTQGLSVVVMDPLYLLTYVGSSVNLTDYFLHFDTDGKPSIVRYHVPVMVDLYENVMRVVQPYEDGPSVVLNIDPQGFIKPRLVNVPAAKSPPPTGVIALYWTTLGQNNLPIKSCTVTFGDITKGVTLSAIPVGLPGDQFTLWGKSDDHPISITWVEQNA